jgi:hypothetical protein
VTRRIRYEIEPMTLGNMRELGVRSLDVSCWNCQHRAVLSADRWPDNVAVPTFGPRMVVTGLSAPPRARADFPRYWRSSSDFGRRLGGNFHA